MSSRATVFSGTKDGSIKVERVFAGVVTERFIVGPKRDCPTFKGQTFEKFPEWKKMAISYLQQRPTVNPIFFHVEGPIIDLGIPPVYEEKMGWYYWDETWAYYHGPFSSYDLAQADLVAYFKWLSSPKEELPGFKCALPNTVTAPEPRGESPIKAALDGAFRLAIVEAATVVLDEMAAKIVPPVCALCGGATVDCGEAKDVVLHYNGGKTVVIPDGKVSYCPSCTHHPISEYLT